MANMKSIVCTKANQLVKEGYTKSAAFVRAWALAKAEVISDQLFYMNMKDRYNAADREYVAKLQIERSSLYTRANTCKKIEAPKTLVLTDAEKAEINERLTKIMLSSRPDWTEFKALEARLNQAA